jgi:predicted nuclease of predicted toxin-antitoxin system
VRFLLDECLAVRLSTLLRNAEHDCTHIYELGMSGALDDQVMAVAEREHRILISADIDSGELLAHSPVLAPSVILVRRADKRAEPLATIILANLDQIAGDLTVGALVVISDTRIRTRKLPVKPQE